jgi:hypothetical protein
VIRAWVFLCSLLLASLESQKLPTLSQQGTNTRYDTRDTSLSRPYLSIYSFGKVTFLIFLSPRYKRHVPVTWYEKDRKKLLCDGRLKNGWMRKIGKLVRLLKSGWSVVYDVLLCVYLHGKMSTLDEMTGERGKIYNTLTFAYCQYPNGLSDPVGLFHKEAEGWRKDYAPD